MRGLKNEVKNKNGMDSNSSTSSSLTLKTRKGTEEMGEGKGTCVIGLGPLGVDRAARQEREIHWKAA